MVAQTSWEPVEDRCGVLPAGLHLLRVRAVQHPGCIQRIHVQDRAVGIRLYMWCVVYIIFAVVSTMLCSHGSDWPGSMGNVKERPWDRLTGSASLVDRAAHFTAGPESGTYVLGWR
jgi:hypothetical protein